MSHFTIQEAKKEDLSKLLALYTHLNDNPYPAIDSPLEKLWADMVHDARQHILLGYTEETLVSSCVLIIIPNLTHGQRPYALIENVITHPHHRKRGYGSLLLTAARDIAARNDCYKIMLMTGSKDDSTLRFYRQAGYNTEDKTAFIQWL